MDTVAVEQGDAAWNLVEVKYWGKIAAPCGAMGAVSASVVALDPRKDESADAVDLDPQKNESTSAVSADAGVHGNVCEARGSKKRECNRRKTKPNRLYEEKRHT